MEPVALDLNKIKTTPLVKIFPELSRDVKERIRYVTPDDTIAKLVSTMRIFRIRTIPVLTESEGNSDFNGLISEVDLARYLPPNNARLPEKRLRDKGFSFGKLFEHNKAVGITKISAIPNFEPMLNRTPSEGRTAALEALTKNNTFLESIAKFLEKFGDTKRRYRTFPILDENNKFMGVLSYIDVLRTIAMSVRDISNFFGDNVNHFCNTKVETLTASDPFYDAVYTLTTNPFTHVPITAAGSTKVIGILDEVIVASLEHNLIYEYISDMPLSEIMSKVDRNITIAGSDNLETLIGKFDQFDRPTAVLVGEWQSGEFNMTGIVSYVDIFRKFIEWVNQNSQIR